MKQFSRRNFLAQSALATVAAPFIVRSAFGQGNSPNEKIGVMIVGTGGQGGNHVNAMLDDPRTVVLYLCDPDTGRATRQAEKVAEKQGSTPKVIRDMREALADPQLDLVMCAAVNHWHALCGIWALQAGKHVFLEKPICSSIHEGWAITAAAKKYGKVVQVGTQRRSHRAHIEAVKFVQEGGIGEVKLARGICYKRRRSIGPPGQYPVPANVDYNLWCGPCPDDPPTRRTFHYDWHWQRKYGNGEIGNNGPHFNDLARWYLGLDRFPNSVFAYGGRVGYDVEQNRPGYVDAGDTPNTHVSVYDYGDKTIVMECRGLETPQLRGVDFGAVIYGSEGYLTTNGDAGNLCIVFDLTGKEIKRFTGGGNRFTEFVDAVEKNDPSIVKADARCGALSAALCHLGEIAYYVGESNKQPIAEIEKVLADNADHLATFKDTIGHLEKNGVDANKTMLSISKVLKIDPATEKFTDSEEANKLITRPYRVGFVVPDADKV
jgi:predicted dehydrogenase